MPTIYTYIYKTVSPIALRFDTINNSYNKMVFYIQMTGFKSNITMCSVEYEGEIITSYIVIINCYCAQNTL